MTTTARRTRALSTMHAFSVGAVVLAGVGLVAARAAESTETPPSAAGETGWLLDRTEVSCIRTHPVDLGMNGGAPWQVHDRDQTFTVTDGRTVIQSRDGDAVVLEAGESFTVPAFDRHRYEAVGEGRASMTVDAACTPNDRPDSVAADVSQG